VISGIFPPRIGLPPARAFVLLGLLFLTGCEPDPYPEAMVYPVRTDPLIELKVKVRDIPYTWGPGQLDAHLRDVVAMANSEADKNKFGAFDPTKLTAEQRQKIGEVLTKYFGTPANPTVALSGKEGKALIKELQIDDDTLAAGSVLYRRHCLHCHGVTGDGHGPTANWVNPPPRDYRRGLFKFVSVVGGPSGRPRRSDLLRTLTEGIEGTSMPTFKAQPQRDLEALVGYVIHLSIRGTVEYDILRDVLSNESANLSEVLAEVKEKVNGLANSWNPETNPSSPQYNPSNALIEPHPYPYKGDLYSGENQKEFHDSVREGYKLFIGEGICRECHIDFGRQAKFLYDEWGTLVRPNNLTMGVYRGGRRPIDLYYRVHSGIYPSTMTGVAATEKLKNDKRAIWDLVNFVRALPYPEMLPPDIKDKVYGARK
jgi:mono/diheme cytochrome c family protein